MVEHRGGSGSAICGDKREAMMIVTFCGHSKVPQHSKMLSLLSAMINGFIEEGATDFYLGGYGDFDHLAALAVHNAKNDCAAIRSFLIIPYMEREYDNCLYDASVYPPLENVPRKFAILKRNEWMIDQSDVVVAYVTHDWGGAATALKYARRKKKRIVLVDL